MPQAGNIAIQNGAATPANVTFAVEQVSTNLSVFADRASGIGAFFRRLKLSLAPANSRSSVNRSKLSIECPVYVTDTSGVKKLAYVNRGSVEFIFNEMATDDERKDVYAFAKNALANASITATLRDVDPQY